MDRIERVLSYVLLVLFILLMVLSTLISFDLSTSLFHPINFAQEVLWYIPTAVFLYPDDCNTQQFNLAYRTYCG
jgi:hypothetical protein